MARPKKLYITGDYARAETREDPDWEPLRDLVGMELADWFMATHSIRLEDGTLVRAYKHYVTRRYLHLGVDGRAFLFATTTKVPNRYLLISRSAAIDEAFMNWDVLGGGPDDPRHQEELLERARGYAERGEPHPYSQADADERDEENRRWAAENPDPGPTINGIPFDDWMAGKRGDEEAA